MARYKFCFWLDSGKDDELLLMEDIDELKQQRLFTSTIRDGIRLIMDLRRGNFDVLLELFPEIRHWLKDPDSDSRAGHNKDDIRAVLVKLERLEAATLQQTAPQLTKNGSTLQPIGGPKKLNTPALAAPTFDDDDDDILTVKRDTSTHSARNFIEATLGLQR